MAVLWVELKLFDLQWTPCHVLLIGFQAGHFANWRLVAGTMTSLKSLVVPIKPRWTTPAGVLWDVLIGSMSGWLRWCVCRHRTCQPVFEQLCGPPKHLHSVSWDIVATLVVVAVGDPQWSWWTRSSLTTGFSIKSLKWEEPSCVYGWVCRYSTSCSLRLVSPG